VTESDDLVGHEELSPAEALASTQVAREVLARRVGVPWTWHAFIAAGLAAYIVLVAVPLPWWAFWVLAPWLPVFVVFYWDRTLRVGVKAGRAAARRSDPLRWWVGVALVAVPFAGMMLDVRWQQARLLSGLFDSLLLFVGLRWLNRRAIARIRNAA